MNSYAFQATEDINCAKLSSNFEAISCSDSSNWITVMNEEMESLHRNGTWQLVSLPKGRNVVGCKWIFKKKPRISVKDGLKYKAWLVVKGFSQRDIQE